MKYYDYFKQDVSNFNFPRYLDGGRNPRLNLSMMNPNFKNFDKFAS